MKAPSEPQGNHRAAQRIDSRGLVDANLGRCSGWLPGLHVGVSAIGCIGPAPADGSAPALGSHRSLVLGSP
jgi:hypothetical protein